MSLSDKERSSNTSYGDKNIITLDQIEQGVFLKKDIKEAVKELKEEFSNEQFFKEVPFDDSISEFIINKINKRFGDKLTK